MLCPPGRPEKNRMSYAELASHFRKIGHLSHVDAILSWDEAVMMPDGGGAARADAMAALRGLIHELSTEPRVGELVERADRAEERARSMMAERPTSARYGTATCEPRRCPRSLVEASAKAEARSEQAWRKLRAQNDWATFLPLLEEVVARKRDASSLLAEKLGCSRYDALLDGFEPSAKSADDRRPFRGAALVLAGFHARRRGAPGEPYRHAPARALPHRRPARGSALPR